MKDENLNFSPFFCKSNLELLRASCQKDLCVFLFLFCFLQNRFLFSRGIVSLFYGSVLANDKLPENGLLMFLLSNFDDKTSIRKPLLK